MKKQREKDGEKERERRERWKQNVLMRPLNDPGKANTANTKSQ